MYHKTLSYYSTIFYRSFAAFTGEQLQAVGLNFGLLFFVIYVGKHPGCSPSELTKALYLDLSLIHISEPKRRCKISYSVVWL